MRLKRGEGNFFPFQSTPRFYYTLFYICDLCFDKRSRIPPSLQKKKTKQVISIGITQVKIDEPTDNT